MSNLQSDDILPSRPLGFPSATYVPCIVCILLCYLSYLSKEALGIWYSCFYLAYSGLIFLSSEAVKRQFYEKRQVPSAWRLLAAAVIMTLPELMLVQASSWLGHDWNIIEELPLEPLQDHYYGHAPFSILVYFTLGHTQFSRLFGCIFCTWMSFSYLQIKLHNPDNICSHCGRLLRIEVVTSMRTVSEQAFGYGVRNIVSQAGLSKKDFGPLASSFAKITPKSLLLRGQWSYLTCVCGLERIKVSLFGKKSNIALEFLGPVKQNERLGAINIDAFQPEQSLLSQLQAAIVDKSHTIDQRTADALSQAKKLKHTASVLSDWGRICTRGFAKLCDMALAWAFVYFAFSLSSIEQLFAAVAIDALIETTSLCLFATTFGKNLCKIRINDRGGGRLSLIKSATRTMHVLLKGLGALVPFITFFTVLFAIERMLGGKECSWDDDHKVLYGVPESESLEKATDHSSP